MVLYVSQHFPTFIALSPKLFMFFHVFSCFGRVGFGSEGLRSTSMFCFGDVPRSIQAHASVSQKFIAAAMIVTAMTLK